MKKFIIALLIIFIWVGFASAEKGVTLPNYLLLNSNKATLVGANFLWGATAVENTCIVTFRIQNDDRSETYKLIAFTISGSDFAALVNGYGATMEGRLEAAAWQEIQSRFSLVP